MSQKVLLNQRAQGSPTELLGGSRVEARRSEVIDTKSSSSYFYGIPLSRLFKKIANPSLPTSWWGEWKSHLLGLVPTLAVQETTIQAKLFLFSGKTEFICYGCHNKASQIVQFIHKNLLSHSSGRQKSKIQLLVKVSARLVSSHTLHASV